MTARLALLLLALAALTACSGPAAAPSATPVASGIRGRVILGPTCPVQASGQTPCLTPHSATLVLTDRDGKEVARTTSGQDGRFEFAVGPGQYTIQPQPGQPFPQAQPLDVTVVPGQFLEVEINYDTGIR